jgi:hypothetical protein
LPVVDVVIDDIESCSVERGSHCRGVVAIADDLADALAEGSFAAPMHDDHVVAALEELVD